MNKNIDAIKSKAECNLNFIGQMIFAKKCYACKIEFSTFKTNLLSDIDFHDAI